MAMKYILPLFSVFALYSIFHFSGTNGLRGLIKESIASNTLPESNDALRTVYTGFEPLDEILTILTTFFWPAISGIKPELTLHAVAFSGTFGSAWVLVTLESWRRGNAWTIAAFPMAFGLVAQVLTYAFATPLYCGLQLASSITASKPNAENIRIPRAVLHMIPLIFTVGYIVPSVLAILPAPELITVDQKQIFASVWQPWPAYISILVTTVSIVFSPFVSNDRNVEGGWDTLRALRRVYAFAFANTAIPHIVTLTVSFATVVAPFMFEERYVNILHPLHVFQVVLPWSSVTVDNIADGVRIFLGWDYLVGSAGVLVWAMTLYSKAHKAILGKVSCLDLFVKVGLLTVLTGPVGAAVELMWERDELVVHETGGLKQRVATGKKVQ
ncbi:hypothetical protein ASPWEDRAFT_170432 [Aspergillus wentii DTO 134E9]|uniref:Uncharacterized protein n=1 Tax=Aspergillus wentii DTO 134E9 TaxID=1073089 RepID=A0A1L9RPR9_ASPWE|nr:uncharacterized protein ASPWEDRAFT_170432 [Aspergillus wentii DTO 134E9]KAI9923932.1 hypothetical protein MW887_008238 [Aspergillus wentii]OJJ36929.1 hypothetical protein ASPWEDRAFT_170432 [Aspergillus wentii DTO 134E9]